jgi:hypothetical protein
MRSVNDVPSEAGSFPRDTSDADPAASARLRAALSNGCAGLFSNFIAVVIAGTDLKNLHPVARDGYRDHPEED